MGHTCRATRCPFVSGCASAGTRPTVRAVGTEGAAVVGRARAAVFAQAVNETARLRARARRTSTCGPTVHALGQSLARTR